MRTVRAEVGFTTSVEVEVPDNSSNDEIEEAIKVRAADQIDNLPRYLVILSCPEIPKLEE